jgi:uncharacterized protein (TIGR03066 family)
MSFRTHRLVPACAVLVFWGLWVVSGSAPSSAAPAPPRREATNQEKVVGAWELTKSASGEPIGATLVFTPEGRIKLSATVEGKAVNLDGTYAVDGDTLTVTWKVTGADDFKVTTTITKLTETALVTRDDRGKLNEYKKK